MIEVVGGFPDHVLAIKASGHVTRDDYRTVLVPAVEAGLQHHAKLRLYYQIGKDFAGIDSGAAWEDFKIGVEHLTRWERIAVVTDVAWIRPMAGAFAFLMPGDVRAFALADDSEARTWVASN